MEKIYEDGKIIYKYHLGEKHSEKSKDEVAEDLIEKIFYSPAEVAEILKESASCIRFWNDRILENNERRHGKRIYTKAIIGKLLIVQNLLRVQKYTVLGTKQKIQKK